LGWTPVRSFLQALSQGRPSALGIANNKAPTRPLGSEVGIADPLPPGEGRVRATKKRPWLLSKEPICDLPKMSVTASLDSLSIADVDQGIVKLQGSRNM